MPKRKDYDTPWKEALALYLPRFFQFFFPDIASEIDWNRGFKFLDKELRKLERRAATGNREVDSLVEVYPQRGPAIWVLVHIEVQSQVDQAFPERMFTYHVRIMDRFQRPVTSLAVLGDKSPNWRPSNYSYSFWGSQLSLSFPIAKVLDFEPRLPDLERSTNPFALLVAATLHTQRTEAHDAERREAKYRLVRGLFLAGLDKGEIQQFFRLVDWIMTLSAEENERFEQQMVELEEETRMPFITSFERKGLERGLEQGRQTLREATISILRRRFQLDPTQIPDLTEFRDEKILQNLVERAAVAGDMDEFSREVERLRS